MAATFLTLFSLLALAISATAEDPDMLQDLCVADLTSGVKENGFACKEAAAVNGIDFFFDGLATPGSTNNTMGCLVGTKEVEKIKSRLAPKK
ncbi:hypothetical protein MRB53_028896 [Persea americana]|uniref:Uncharacterized protein n=1 Tax=Persea americana TaxID=3435 RepID=A0ACC2KGS6_PERAE|nr:hypothetical protein MRB53_028896 [Persea americana]